MFKDVPTILFPAMWFEERATLTPELASSVGILLQLPTAGLFCSLGLLLAGLVSLGLVHLPRVFPPVLDDRRTERNRWQLKSVTDKCCVSACRLLCNKGIQMMMMIMTMTMMMMTTTTTIPYWITCWTQQPRARTTIKLHKEICGHNKQTRKN
jgi:hypothetical protein